MNHLWRQCQAAICSLTFENANGRITSGSGFKVGDYLITNNHVIQVTDARRIVIRSVNADSHTTALDISFGHLEFRTFLVEGDPETAWDFAILRIPGPEFQALPSLELAEEDEIEVGSQIAIFGYQFDQAQLSMHMGYLASQYFRAGVHYLQLDSSVNHGNSGGPLIDAVTGKVRGIVTRKATGLTQQFDALLHSFQQNINQLQVMQQGGARAIIAGLDPVAAMLATQTQMQRIAQEIGRSANVGIGYAYHINKIRASLARHSTESPSQ
ncbi:MAG: serine protease [Burkholderiales bacterium]|jgi:S1-C subfamily serine protease|uniref:S1 family peptidase n=1 Tax=Limnobacter sp. TaxID=2003368 RepID=UPI0039BC465C|nr:serine protease [Burkholderiales bacterium]